MIIEPIRINDDHFLLSEQIYNELIDKEYFKNNKLSIGICGESGSGKTVTSVCLQQFLEKKNINSVILHLDSYYKLTPKENHEKRKADINWVGVNELNISMIDRHIEQFKSNKDKIKVPVVDYQENKFLETIKYLKNVSVIIIEGVYAFYVKELDYKIFLEKTFKDTLESRMKRTREIYDTFVEKVLEIEHELVVGQKIHADLIIDKDYNIKD